jgi:hypothetical protein
MRYAIGQTVMTWVYEEGTACLHFMIKDKVHAEQKAKIKCVFGQDDDPFAVVNVEFADGYCTLWPMTALSPLEESHDQPDLLSAVKAAHMQWLECNKVSVMTTVHSAVIEWLDKHQQQVLAVLKLPAVRKKRTRSGTR